MKLPEIVAVGIYNSKYAGGNVDISKNRKVVMFEIELPVTNGGVSHIDEETKKIKTDTVICAKPGQTRHTKFPFVCYYVHLLIHEGELYDALISAPNFLEIENSTAYLEIFRNLLKYYNTGVKSHEIKLNALLLELIYMISKGSKNRFSGNLKTNNFLAVEKAIKYIKENLSEPLDLQTVADYVNVSPIYFHNRFKTSVGKTLHEFIEDERLKSAVNLLVTTDMTLAEIAYICGFSSQSYFSFVFKRKMKTTPRRYIQKLNEMYEK